MEVIEGVPTIVWSNYPTDTTTVADGATRSLRFKVENVASTSNPMKIDDNLPVFHATLPIKISEASSQVVTGGPDWEIGYGPNLDSDVGMVVLFRGRAGGATLQKPPRLIYLPPGNYLQLKGSNGTVRWGGVVSCTQEVAADSNLNDGIDGSVPS